MTASVAARLRKLEEAEEAHEVERWSALLAEAYEIDLHEAQEILERAVIACKQCASFGGDSLRRAACMVRVLDLDVEPAVLRGRLAQLTELRAGGMTDEELVRFRLDEGLPIKGAHGADH